MSDCEKRADETIEEMRDKVVRAVIAHGWSRNEPSAWKKGSKIIIAGRHHMTFFDTYSGITMDAYYSEVAVGSRYISIGNKDVQVRAKL